MEGLNLGAGGNWGKKSFNNLKKGILSDRLWINFQDTLKGLEATFAYYKLELIYKFASEKHLGRLLICT